jgi:hypothetical protein
VVCCEGQSLREALSSTDGYEESAFAACWGILCRICIVSPYPDPTNKTADHPWDRSQNGGRLLIVHTIHSSANCDCYEGCNGFTLQQTLLSYHRSQQSQIAVAWAWS